MLFHILQMRKVGGEKAMNYHKDVQFSVAELGFELQLFLVRI